MARVFDAVQWLVLGAAGVGAFYAAASFSRQAASATTTVVAPVPRPARPAAQPPQGATSEPAQPVQPSQGDRQGSIPRDTGPLFAPTSWVPPPAPLPRPIAVTAAPPAPPVAPPLPFTFVGLVEKGTPKPQAFLSKGDELLVVSPGDLLDNGSYRVDAVSPNQIVFMHLPTNTKQVINLSGGSQ